MIKQTDSPAKVQPGRICGFFEQNVFHAALILEVNDNRCTVLSDQMESSVLQFTRLVLFSEIIYPLDKPEPVLEEFNRKIEVCRQNLSLPDLRLKLLQKGTDLTLQEVLEKADLPGSDACRFALFLELRAHPAWFRFRKGLCHALTQAEQQEYRLAEEQKALHERDLEVCPRLAKKGLPVLFSSALLAEAEQVAEFEETFNRMDLIPLDCWTIDAKQSRDLDDAISLSPKKEGWELGIHITDLTFFIALDSALDLEARRRASSAYLPEIDVHMFPESISCGKASLLEDTIRPALSIVCNISPDWEVSSWLAFPAQIRISRNYSYEEFEAFLSDDVPDFNPEMKGNAIILKQVTDRHLEKRVRDGAVLIEDSSLSPARKIVAECMVIYNSILADLTAENDVPLFYRFPEAVEDLPKADADRVFLPPAVMGTEPHPHSAMGLKVYAQLSSPLRRYSDLVNQRQTIAFLNGDQLPYTKEQLDNMLDHLTQTRSRIRQITLQAEKSL